MRQPDGDVRAQYRALAETLASLPPEELQRRKQSADISFLTQGITFTVYGRDEGTERIFPYDLLPRLITAQEWERIERGLTQRITARTSLQLQALPAADAGLAGAAQRLCCGGGF